MAVRLRLKNEFTEDEKCYNLVRWLNYCIFQFLANGTMVIKQVYMEDQGLYGCTANNSAGRIRTEAFVYIAGECGFLGVN